MTEFETVSTTIGILVACTTVVIGVVNQILSNRRAEEQRAETQKTQQLTLETRQAQLFAQIHAWWRTRDAVKAYGLVRYAYHWTDLADWMTRYHPSVDPEKYADFMTLNAFFEGLGIFVKRGLIDIELVEDLFSQRIIWLWEAVHVPTVMETRRVTGDPTQYDCFEYLYNEMKKRQLKQAVT